MRTLTAALAATALLLLTGCTGSPDPHTPAVCTRALDRAEQGLSAASQALAAAGKLDTAGVTAATDGLDQVAADYRRDAAACRALAD